MTRAGALAALGLWCGHALTAVRLDAQGARSHPEADSTFLFRAGLLGGLALAAAAAPLGAQAPPADSTFLLTTNDPARTPSPFIGNGRLGVVIPALGIGATPSIAAGLYEHGKDDVPRIASVPAWNAVAVAIGDRWLEPGRDSIASYRQTIDMRTARAATRYDWIAGSRSTTVRMETFISRADPRL